MTVFAAKLVGAQVAPEDDRGGVARVAMTFEVFHGDAPIRIGAPAVVVLGEDPELVAAAAEMQATIINTVPYTSGNAKLAGLLHRLAKFK